MPAENVHELGLVSLLYVSRSLVQEHAAEDQIDNIVSVALARNATLNVTGALLFTGAHFAQALEGPRQAISQLMNSLERDTRHREVTTVRLAPLRKRQFPDWAMAYSGVSPYLDRHVKPLLSPLTRDEDRGELIEGVLDVLRSLRPQGGQNRNVVNP